MDQDSDGAEARQSATPSARTLKPEAQRALAEAKERRRKAADAAAQAQEFNGRGGLEPVRFGDWEVKGIATDF
ncbi:DUF1674 domain-containing protein [Beijerinckia sp. L45]|uniref:DUF1674 domain-containing protein n=1 Tax=Beijerinckia sp. L45 TaxID=1641855 RepID=UPI00131D5A90|nr:DUF1674 domain-containing protein [Beijerinckia sp. L45]